MKIKLFLDEDIHLGVGMSLRKRGYDVVHVNEINRKGKSDVEQLEYAIETERCFFSFNIKDFVILHSEYVQKKKKHFGIIVSKQLPIGLTINKLLQILQLHNKDMIKNQLRFL